MYIRTSTGLTSVNKIETILSGDFHCHVIFKYVRMLTLTGFTCVNEIETLYGRPRVNVKKLNLAQLLRSCVAFHTSSLFYLCT